VALLPWGNVLEDFLDDLGVSLDDFFKHFVGSWMFGYVAALHSAGLDTVLFCVSERVKTPLRGVHRPSGARVCVLPTTRAYRWLRARMQNPYGRSVTEAFEVGGVCVAALPLLALSRQLALYLPTPVALLARELRRERCGIILCQEYEYPRFDVCVLLGRLLGLPVFGIFQGGDSQRSRLESLIRPLTVSASSGLIIAPEREFQRVQARYRVGPDKVARIFNPIDTEVWRPLDRVEARRALGLPVDARIAAWHGRMSLWQKGLDILMDAWQQVCRERPMGAVLLLLIGTGEDVDAIRRWVLASGCPGSVILRDEFVADRELIRRYLSAANVYVFPSRHEGLAVAPIEAMSCGLPIVASDVSGVGDVLDGPGGEAGLVVAPDDARALATGLGLLLDNEELSRSMGRLARARVEERFAIDRVGQQLREVLLGSRQIAADRYMRA
jgi:starch synthase